MGNKKCCRFHRKWHETSEKKYFSYQSSELKIMIFWVILHKILFRQRPKVFGGSSNFTESVSYLMWRSGIIPSFRHIFLNLLCACTLTGHKIGVSQRNFTIFFFKSNKSLRRLRILIRKSFILWCDFANRRESKHGFLIFLVFFHAK